MQVLARLAPEKAISPIALPVPFQGDLALGDVMQKRSTKRLTTAAFIERSRATHGDRYDYSLVEYKNYSTKVKVICPDHGVFEQFPQDHMRGSKCRLCANVMRLRKSNKTVDDRWRTVKARFIEKHGDRYDYSLVEYRRSDAKIKIICPDHGIFEQTPNNHANFGCRQCGLEQTKSKLRLDQESLLDRFCSVHGDRYDYSKVEYRSSMHKVEIVCPDHGPFWQLPHSHLLGQGCPRCGKIAAATERVLGAGTVIEKFRDVHGDRYDYSLVDIVNSRTKVKIICPDHGVFEQPPGMHYAGQGCPKCAHSYPLTQEDVIAKFAETHGDRYDYSDVIYRHSQKRVKILCRKHGAFWQIPGDHIRGHGCWRCGVEDRLAQWAKSVSKVEIQMRDYIDSLGVSTQVGYIPESDARWTFDVLVPERNLAFEFNGIYWHSYPRAHRGQHYHKRKNAEKHGYRLITIWEDDWKFKRERMESLIRRAILGPETRIGARETDVIPVSMAIAKPFHEEHHVQDFALTVAPIHYALYDASDLVAVASFSREGVLHRYTILDGLSISGGLSKLIKAFRRDHGDVPITTYCDMDHFTGGMYRAAGFEHVSGTLTMSYVAQGRRQRREHFMKHKLPVVFGEVDMDKREVDICAENGVFACWNSGTEKYVLPARQAH